jgi:hypothetical protein
MLPDFADDVPTSLQGIGTRPLFVMRLSVKPLQIVGAAPGGFRRVGIVPAGSFSGSRLAGEVLDGGADWQIVRTDGATTLDVRLVLKTDDGALIAMSYRGLRQGPREVIARLEAGEAVDPASYYFRITATFETAAANLQWLNNLLAIGVGQRGPTGVIYSLFELI